jgi:hypothetical protein
MLWEPIYIVILVAIDILFTYVLLNKTIELGKGKDYEEHEANPVVRFFIKKYGIHKGMRFAALYSVTAISLVLYYLSIRYTDSAFRNMLYFIMGVYSMMMLMHIASWRMFAQLEGKKKGVQNAKLSRSKRK